MHTPTYRWALQNRYALPVLALCTRSSETESLMGVVLGPPLGLGGPGALVSTRFPFRLKKSPHLLRPHTL